MSTQQERTSQIFLLKTIAGCCLAVSVLSLAIPPAQGQSAPSAPAAVPPANPVPATASQQAQFPTVSASANEVSLDLVVHDKHHKPVLDLKPEDIIVTDNDVPVKLSGFHLVQGSASMDSGHMITLLFDHFDGPTARAAKIVADKILKTLPTKGYVFSVLDFSGRLRLIQGFTEDRSNVESAIELVTEKTAANRATTAEAAEKNLVAIARTGADSSGRHAEFNERTKAQALLKALGDAQLIVQDQHARQSLAGLLALIRSQQQISERKALIYFTQNEQMDSAAKEMIRTITGAATRAGVTVYTVDLDAMDVGGQHQIANAMLNGQAAFNPAPIATSPYTSVTPMQQESAAPISGTPGLNGPSWGPNQDIAVMTDFARGNNDKNPFADIKSPMADLARDTGGIYIDAQSSVKGPLQQMLQDMSTYYQASYIPPIQEYDGKFREIAVKPMRTGLNVQTRTGYFALPPGSAGGIRPFEAPLVKILADINLPSDFKFNASILRFGNLPDGNTNTLAVEIPISELKTHEDTHTNLYSAHVSVVAQIKDLNGTVVEHFGEDIARRGALESLDRDSSLAITMQRHFVESPGQYVLEIAVSDLNAEKASARRIKFEIPPPSGGPSLSDIVLVKKMDTFDREADPEEPLSYESGKVTPNLSGVVGHDSKSVSMFLILHPDPQSHDYARLEMEVSRNGKPGRLMPLPLRVGSTSTSVPYLASFQTKSLAPGDYEVKALVNQGGKTAEQIIAFRVEGNQPEDIATADSPHPGGGASPVDTASTSITLASAPGELAITIPTTAVPPPTPDETQLMIADARERALRYTESLPNFLCIQVTNRSVDSSGYGNWKRKDTIAELLRYRDKAETRTTIEVNGKATNTDRQGMEGPFSTGELGGVLRAVFEDTAKAEFHWKETDALGDQTLQVFDYRVAKANSSFALTGSNGTQIMVSFHGQVYFDSATHSVRRITLIADELPKDFPTRATAIRVDYDYVAINAHDYLMPVSAEVSQLQGRHEATLNTIQFRNYKRYGSSVKLNFGDTSKP